MTHDVRYALRLLWRQPRFTALVILTMAVGIGATTTLFSVAYGVLLRPLPWPNADRVIVLKETRGGQAPRFGAMSNAAVVAWSEQPETITAIATWAPGAVTMVTPGADPERVQSVTASGALFSALGVTPIRGTLFNDTDPDINTIVISGKLWQRRFGGSADAVGSLVRVDGQPRRIVAILPDAAAFPNAQTEAWLPMRVTPVTGNSLSMFNAIAVLAPGSTPQQAADEGTARGRYAPDTGMTTMAIFGTNGPIAIAATPLRESLTGDVTLALLVLLSAVGLLLAAATANLAGLQLARAAARRREIAIRAAIGASTGRLARQLLVENIALGIAGGAVGIALAWTLHSILPSILPPDFPRIDGIRLDGVVLAVAVASSLATSVGAGFVPALRSRVPDLVQPLADDGKASSGSGRAGGSARARMLIMTGQIAVSAVLLVGAGLLGRSFVTLITVDRGYEPHGVYSARLSLPAPTYTPERRHAIVTQVIDRLSALEGVTAAGFTSELPITAGGSTAAFTLTTPAPDGATSAQASPRLVSAHAFSALGMRIVEGRSFTTEDTGTSEPVAVVNRSFADRYLGDRVAGASIPMGVGYQNPTANARIVGVVDDVTYVTPADVTLPEIYYSYRQLGSRLPVSTVTLLIRTPDEAERVAGAVRGILRQVEPGLAVAGFMTLEERLHTSVARPRLYAIVVVVFAAFALLVSGVGLFGVLSFTLTQRSREFAVRAALGATRAGIGRLVLRQLAGMTIAGLALGFTAATLCMPLAGALLYRVDAHDALTYVGVAMVIAVVGGLAAAGPVLRAARINVASELR